MDSIELAMSVQINLENAEKLQPAISQNPMFVIAKDQLTQLVSKLEDEE